MIDITITKEQISMKKIEEYLKITPREYYTMSPMKKFEMNITMCYAGFFGMINHEKWLRELSHEEIKVIYIAKNKEGLEKEFSSRHNLQSFLGDYSNNVRHNSVINGWNIQRVSYKIVRDQLGNTIFDSREV